MVDRLTPPDRSRLMARVKSRNTAPELAVRRALHAVGLRFRLHRRDLPGRPDIVLPKFRTAIFVHGCFWHGHDCRRGTLPVSNAEFWRAKISRNRERDTVAAEALVQAGWSVETVWQCELKEASAALISRIRSRDVSPPTS